MSTENEWLPILEKNLIRLCQFLHRDEFICLDLNRSSEYAYILENWGVNVPFLRDNLPMSGEWNVAGIDLDIRKVDEIRNLKIYSNPYFQS